MGASRKNTPGYWGIALRFFALTVFLATMAVPARSETVPSVPAPATAQSTGAWIFLPYINFLPSGIASLFNGYPTGQAACDAYDAWENSLSSHVGADVQLYFSLFPDYPAQGGCLAYTTYSQWVASGYLGGDILVTYNQNCPTGYATNDPRIGGPSYSTFTCTNYGAPKQCPPVAVGENPFTLDPGGLTCSRPDKVKCPVTPLSQPPFSDACSTSLEAGKGVDVNNKCGTLRDDMDKAASCIADKINALSTPPKPKYSVPSATIRTTEYQDHLLEIWTKSLRLNTIMTSVVFTPETKQACAATYAAILAEKQSHGIDSPPSPSGDAAPHVEHRAIDVPRKIANALMKQVTIETTTIDSAGVETTTITSDVEDYIHSATVNPPACDSNIRWGGRFDPEDDVHFQLPKKLGGSP